MSAQTPEEFAALLSPEIPQAAGDVGLLTTAYVEARYSRHDFLEEDRLAPVRHGWDRIRQALRDLKRTKVENLLERRYEKFRNLGAVADATRRTSKAAG